MKHFLLMVTKPRLWLALFLLWMTLLWVLSSSSKVSPQEGPQIPHFDKIAHFGYFFGGGIILSTWLLLKHSTRSSALTRYLAPIVFFAIFGLIDEYHQTFTPGRSGNDVYDWLADFFGSFVGILLANHFHPYLIKFSSPSTLEPEN